VFAKPVYLVFKSLFYRIIIKAYGAYFAFIKRVGWKEKKITILSFLHQKLSHITILIITVCVIYGNLTYKSKVQAESVNPEKTILSTLIANEFSTLEEEELVEQFFDQETIISQTQQDYLDSLSAIRPQPVASTKALEEELAQEDLNAISSDGSSLIKPDMVATEKAKRTRKSAETYTVQNGDTISTIARQFEVNVSTILWENDLSPYSIIRPGDQLVILPTAGVTHKVAKNETLSSISGKYSINQEDILAANSMDGADSLQIGQKLFIPGGQKITYVAYKPKVISGISVIRDIVTSKPSRSQSLSGNKMAWPTVGHRITQYYSWRHTGLDIANKVGTPIYATDAGTIEYAGWGTGYGNQIVVNHGGGKKTRYAHLSKFYAKKGDSVGKGEAIGAMGSTGWSTGSHLHFEVIISGGKYNPLNYIK
jgi:murein DD-endopeptidase MepM/ murein hydrolase activator NlpD